MQLIEENCVKKGYSEKKTRKVVALVKNTLKTGVPKIEDLEDLLADIGVWNNVQSQREHSINPLGKSESFWWKTIHESNQCPTNGRRKAQ